MEATMNMKSLCYETANETAYLGVSECGLSHLQEHENVPLASSSDETLNAQILRDATLERACLLV